MADREGFQRDPNAGAHLAAQFGSGAGTAEQVIEANSLRFSNELVAANSLPVDAEASKEVDRGQLASAAGVEEGDILDVAVRGNYVTYVYSDSTGRVHKNVVQRDGDSLSAVDESSDPRRARIAAQAQAARQVQEARSEAEKIIAEAQEKAAKMVAEAAQKSQEQASETQQKAAEEHREQSEGEDIPRGEAGEQEQGKPTVGGSTRSRRK